MEEDWSRAISSANLGKTVATKGLVEVGSVMVRALTWMVVVGLIG